MNLYKTLIAATGLCLFSGIAAAANTHVINDPQEITAFVSGYDVKTITFTLDANDTLTMDIEPYGVPGDTDGDGNPNASSDPTVIDDPGVGSTEFLRIGMVCADPTVCVPDLLFTYTNNTLTVNNPAAGPASMAVGANAYTLTIPNFTAFKAALGGTPANFTAFSFSAGFADNQVDDFAPDLDATTGAPVCEQVSLEPPVVGKTPFDCYAINKLLVVDKPGTTKDIIKVKKAGFRLDPPNTVDLSTDMVQIRIDGLTFDFPPGSFTQVGSKPDYVFKSASGSVPFIKARIRFDKATWAIRVKKGDATLIDNSDGVDVALMIGNFESTENVMLSAHGHYNQAMKFERHPKVSCRHATSDSSDDGVPGYNKLSCLSSMTVQHSSGTMITKTRAAGLLVHPNTVYSEDATGDIGIFHTSCSQCLHCGDMNGNFTIVEIDGLPGDKMAQKCGVPDASCTIMDPNNPPED